MRLQSRSMPTVEKSTDIRVVGVSVFFLQVATRTPLKFGRETLTAVTCCRVRVTVCDRKNQRAVGWGETPLSVQWGWPADLAYAFRNASMQQFVLSIAEAWADSDSFGHPIELAFDFQQERLPALLENCNSNLDGAPMPYLAALICSSAFDIALHDAYGNLHQVDTYET